MKRLSIAVAIAFACLAGAQTDVKGQGQLAGGTAKFGTVYSLKNGFNFEILGGHYSLEPFNSYYPVTAQQEKKILVLDLAIKNASKDDNGFDTSSLFTLVDDHDQLYTAGGIMLESKGATDSAYTLRPGQGLGQPDLKDPLRIAFQVPAKAKITKVMVNVGRLNTSEDVVRYLLVQPPKQGEKPSDPNFISPLPDNVRDASDPFGAVALAEGKGSVGVYVPSGVFDLRVDALPAAVSGQVAGNDPEDGKKFVVATLTARSMMSGDQSFFTVSGGGDASYSLVDADGETYKATSFLKAKSDEDADHTFKLGDEYTYRVVFQVPQNATLKKFVYATGDAPVWAIALP